MVDLIGYVLAVSSVALVILVVTDGLMTAMTVLTGRDDWTR